MTNKMLVWTIQPLTVYEQLKTEGVFRANPAKSELLEIESFRKAYDWMIKQMEERIGKRPENVSTPIWAWHTYDFMHKRPDLRRREFNVGEGNMVCIELEIPESNVLLSDEEAWHYVLGDYYLPKALNESDYIAEEDVFDSLAETDQEIAKSKSWDEIFNIEPFENEWFSRGKMVQATFWELRLEQVKTVRFFKSR